MKRLEVSGAVRPIYGSLRVKQIFLSKLAVRVCFGTAVAQWLRCCATNRKVAGSIPDYVIGMFH